MNTDSTPSLVLRLAVEYFAEHLDDRLNLLGDREELPTLRLGYAIKDAIQGHRLAVTPEEAAATPVRSLREMAKEALGRRAAEGIRSFLQPHDHIDQ